MKIIIQTLTLINFKGIKELTVPFQADTTRIYGDNEAGKTTITDAWHWLLTNKNSSDEKDFNIKNTVHRELNRADHQVSANMIADGMAVELKKVFREKWSKKRGEEFPEFTGHETLYYYNDVPCSQAEYQKKIAELLPEEALKMITNPLYFNTGIKWQQRRNVLLQLAGPISNTDILDVIATVTNKQAVANLTMVLNSGKTVAEYKREIGSRKKKIKDDLAVIPSRIDEVKRAVPLPADYVAIEAQIKAKGNQILNIDGSISDKNAHYQEEYKKLQEHHSKVNKLETRKNEIAFEVKSRLNNESSNRQIARNNVFNKITGIEQDLKSKELLLQSRTQAKSELTERTAKLREHWNEVNESVLTFNEHQFECPTCKREFEAGDVTAKKQDLTTNFLENKNGELDKITERGRGLVGETTECDNMITMLSGKIDGLKVELENAKAELAQFDDANNNGGQTSADEVLASNDEYIQVCASLSTLTSQAPIIKPADFTELNIQKAAIQSEIDALRKTLSTREQIEAAEKRIAELDSEEKSLAQQLADLERTEFLMEDFTKSKMDIMEARINGLFKEVKFKLFERQINGGEDETCETMFKGVPFSDLNTAGKIQAGIDIINTLSKHYGVCAPMFLDNQESVTSLPYTDSQIIKLIVSEPDKQLRVA